MAAKLLSTFGEELTHWIAISRLSNLDPTPSSVPPELRPSGRDEKGMQAGEYDHSDRVATLC